MCYFDKFKLEKFMSLFCVYKIMRFVYKICCSVYIQNSKVELNGKYTTIALYVLLYFKST